jgi:hypothetical protein
LGTVRGVAAEQRGGDQEQRNSAHREDLFKDIRGL